MIGTIKNWAGNYEYSTANVYYPKTTDEVQTLVKRLKKLRVLGSRHSFNGIADSTDNLISLEQFEPTVSINHEQRSVTISGNVTYRDLCPLLHCEGFALHNLASLPHISVVGACITATHGSGIRNQTLSTAISGLEIVTGNGDLVQLSREQDGEQFDGAVINLGGLGVIVKLTLDLLSAFEMSQSVYEHLPVARVDAHFDEIMASAYSVSLFTDWQHDYFDQVWVKRRQSDSISGKAQSDFFGATPATKQMHPIAQLSGEPCTVQFGIPGHWYERLPHFRGDATPSAGNELQSEYFVAREHAVAALRAVSSLRQQFAPHLLVSEIRTIAADNLWLSPCYHRDSVAIHFTWKPDWSAVREVLPLIEAQLAPFNARLHWGKLFTMSPGRIRSGYEKLPEFRQLLRQFDPNGKSRNAFLDTILDG